MRSILRHRLVCPALVLACASGLAGVVAAPLAGAEAAPVPAGTDFVSALDLDFEATSSGWSLRGADVDATVTRGGARSMRLRSEGSDGYALFQRALPGEHALGKWVRLSGWVRTAGLEDGFARLWLRADRGREPLAFDNMDDSALHGDTGWTQVEVSIEVPGDATAVYFGGLLEGTGTAWFDDLVLTFGEAAAPAAAEFSGTAVGPGGEPAAGAVIAVVPAGFTEPAAVVVAGADGAFAVKLPAGAYALTATHPQWVAAYSPPVASSGKSVRDLSLASPAEGFLLAGDIRDSMGAAFADAEVHCLLSLARGDLFVGRADGAGHYALRLPSAYYACRAVAGELRSPLVSVVDGAARKDLLIRRPAPAPQPVVDWIRGQAIPLATPRAGHGFADLAPLREVVGSARVVALGEATHGTREFFQMKHRLLEYLVSELGFSVFAIEANWPESEAVDEYVRVLQQYTKLRSDPEVYAATRDRAMADNLRWIADVAEPGSRTVLWAHNGHINNIDEPIPLMGHHLEAELGKDYLSVGFLFHHGAFQAIDQTGLGYGLKELTVGPPPAGTLEDTFERTGVPLSFLDLRRLPPSGTVAEWFRRSQVMRKIGSTFTSEADMATEVVLPALFEAVIYIEATTRARPNPPLPP